MISSGIAIVQRNPFELTILLALVLLCCSCQGSGIRSSEASPWPSLSAEDPVVRIQTIHTIPSSLDRRNVPFLFPLLKSSFSMHFSDILMRFFKNHCLEFCIGL